MGLTNQEVLDLIKKADKEGGKLTHITSKKKLSAQERFKISLCRLFVKFQNDKKISLKEMSKLTGIPSPRLCEITRYKINLVTVDKLLQQLEKLGECEPRIREHLIMLEQAMDLPMMNVKETKKLTKSLKQVASTGIDSKTGYVFLD